MLGQRESDPRIGAVVAGRYELIALVDKLGKGKVFKAKDTAQGGTACAVKIFISATEAEQNKFLEFYQDKLSGLQHPRISLIKNVEIADNTIFVVSEWVEGRSLYQILNRQGRVDLEPAMQAFIDITEGMDYLHDKGILHLKLNPRKIIMEECNSGYKAKIIDIGISHNIFATPTSLDQSELNGQCSPDDFYYLSPEQCSGVAQDRRADIYSMGCLMYECLIGLPPFLSKVPYEIVKMHQNEEAKPLRMSREDLNFPLELDLLVLKALRKNVNHRQQSMHELNEDLRHALQELLIMPKADYRENTVVVPGVFGLFASEMTEILGHGPASTIKLALPIIIGLFILFGSAVVCFILTPQQIKISLSNSPQDKQWQELESQGQKEYEHGNLFSAELCLEKALPIAETFGAHDRRLLVTLRKLQDIYWTEKKFDKADEVESRIKKLLADD